jgi:histidyl-tRNA synthetase
MESIKALRGFRDVYGEEVEKFNLIEHASRHYFGLLGYREIQVPALEKTELFKRSIGDTTDIVEKEMFTFTDRSGDSVTLRPEGTAGVVRAYLQGSFYAKERVSRLFTTGPMFRHERPQKGRFRQFSQMDVEVFGVAEPIVDAELIWMIHLILGRLNVADYVVEINSVGCKECREEFKQALVTFLRDRKERLCEDCLGRLERNPLRVFDCKVPQCGEAIQDAPVLFDYLCQGCKGHFDECLDRLRGFGVPYALNKRLVRGLDYYTRTVFEVTSSGLGAQKAFVAGGRYDNLVKEMGGPSTPGIGFAFGMDRLASLIPGLPARTRPLYFLAALGEQARALLIPVLKAFVASDMQLAYAPAPTSLKSQMKYAAGLGADYVMIVGEEEVARGVALVRNMADGSQREVALDPERLPELVKQS